MGIAIIKGKPGANALGRTMHNVTPKDPNRRKSFTNDDLKDTRWEEVNGVYKVTYINLGRATQHYEYVLCDSDGNELQSQVGVHINQINGNITLDSNYDGSAVYAKVIPIVDDYYNITINTTPILVIDESGYTLDFAYNNSQGIDARPQQVSMTSFTIYEDDSVVTTDKSELSNASVVVKENANTIYSSDDINANLSIPGNTSSTVRELIVTIQGTYDGVPLSKSFRLSQGADAIDTIGTIFYSGSLVKGTTIDPNDFETMATCLSGKTPYQLHGLSVNPSTIQNSTATYTVTFEGNKSGQIELVPEDSQVVTKAYISGFPTQSAEGANDGPYHNPNTTTHEWPLYVMVTRANGNIEEKTFTEYLALNEPKETYSAPKVSIDSSFTYDSLASVNPTNGTLIFDFENATDYTYDAPKTKINSITLNCTSNSNRSAISSEFRLHADRWDSSYFSSANFEEHPLLEIDQNTQQYIYVDEFSQGIGTNYFRVSSSSKSAKKVIIENGGTEDGGTYYRLKPRQEYYLKIENALSNDISDFAYGAIITRVIPNNSSYYSLTANTYSVTNTKLIDLATPPRTVYIKHTPKIDADKTYQDYTTYIVDGFPRTANRLYVYLNIKILIPKNNN